MTILGIILLILGVAFLILALAGAAREIFKKQKADPSVKLINDVTKLLGAVKELLSQILQGPKWLLVFTAGLVLIGIGVWLVSGGTM